MRNSAETCEDAGRTRPVTTTPSRFVSATGADRGWKHFTRQLPISGQTFWGQWGQGLTGLWHGILPAAAATVIGPVMASAIDVVIGTAMSAPSMATMPSTTDHRWYVRFLTVSGCHTFSILAISAPTPAGQCQRASRMTETSARGLEPVIAQKFQVS
jgi:hypothetical protein